MLGIKRFSLHHRLKLSLPNFEPWTDWMMTDHLGSRRHITIIKAFKIKVCAMLPLMLLTFPQFCMHWSAISLFFGFSP
jgi:hypothetical protein